MTTSPYSDLVQDDYGRPIPGVEVTILTTSGALAILMNADGTALANPVFTNRFGRFLFTAQDGVYPAEFRYGGELIRQDTLIVGSPPVFKGAPGAAGNVAVGRGIDAAGLKGAKAAAASPDDVWFLSEPTRDGLFKMRAGIPPYADADEAIFVVVNGARYWERIRTDGLYWSQWWGAIANGVTNATAALQALVNAGDCVISAQALPYAINAPIVVPSGRKITMQPGTRFKWTGGQPTAALQNEAVFRLADSTAILCAGEWRVECDAETPQLSCVSGFAVQNVRVQGAFGFNCTQAFFNAAIGGVAYDSVVTSAMKAAGDPRAINVCRHIAVIGGGCDFPDRTPTGGVGSTERAGALMFYCENWEVRDARYSGSYCGVQYWGGDSGLAGYQDMGRLGPNMERKNIHGRMTNLYGRRLGAGFWGSCGSDIKSTNCRCYDVGDVGHDHEGSINVTVSDCHGEDCKNGAFTTFSYCRRITFTGCTGKSSVKTYPLVRIYNSGQSQANEDISILSSVFQCTDATGPATVDSSYGPARRITMNGCKLENVAVNFNANNNGHVVITGNHLVFPVRSSVAFNAIWVGGVTSSGNGNPQVLIGQNYIYFPVLQLPGCRAIYTIGTDFNSSAGFRISGNTLYCPLDGGAFAPCRADHVGGNVGLVSVVVFDGNQTDGQLQTNSTGAAAPGSFSARGNFNRTNIDVPLTAV